MSYNNQIEGTDNNAVNIDGIPLMDINDGTKIKSEKGRDFHHPYIPYKIQEEFMETVYAVLEAGNGQIGILESPTGTGKSLSLICASMTWLRDFKRKRFEEGLEWSSDAADEPEWVLEQAKNRKMRDLLRLREEMEARLAKVRAKEKAQQDKYLKEPHGKKRRVDEKEDNKVAQDEEQFVMDDYNSDREGKPPSGKSNSTNSLSTETLALMDKLGMNGGPPKDDEDEQEDEIKVFFCSRTHSQLTQFINELRRVHIPPALTPIKSYKGHAPEIELEEFKHLTLGSRKNLCINPSVSKLRSVTAINERCLDLQQPSISSDKKCIYVPTKDRQPLVASFRDHSLATIRDIEELGSLGREIGICPYYASRSVIKPSEIVTLPYPLLLQKSAREALGISLKGNVVVIDEAHNLMDAINGIHGVSVTLAQLKKSRSQLGFYLQKFRNRLTGKNRVYVVQIVRLLDSLAAYLEGKISTKPVEGIVEPTELLAGKGVDQINLFKLLRYLQESKLARKVEGYIIYTEQQVAEVDPSKTKSFDNPETTSPILQHIASLLAELTNPSDEGLFYYSHIPASSSTPSSTTLKYLLLDPTQSFHATISEARAIILAGGTMSPMSDYTSYLLSYLHPTKITTLSCGHVIPKENLLAWTLSSGPMGKEFEFTYGKREGPEGEEMLDDLGRSLLNICSVVPDGIVVFVPSYNFLESIIQRWQIIASGGNSAIWERLITKKSIFMERKEANGREDVLAEYTTAIDAGKGALLLSVVGGRMSEGINFSDRLGRCVVIVGLPFPNIQSVEWKAKLQYIENANEQKLAAEGIGHAERAVRGKQASREFYENACMRAVNQSVGRAIRHRQDYAAIVMVDKRFGHDKIKGKLPGWIQKGLVKGAEEKSFVELIRRLSAFFRSKKGS